MTPSKIAIFGKTKESTAQLRQEVKKYGFVLDQKKPDIVISYGGDGTFLRSERAYPGIPKALFRFSKICKKCHNLPIDHALESLKEGRYHEVLHLKLAARARGKIQYAVNDIVIRNIEPTHAIRWKLAVNGKTLPHEYIGDGIVAATPHGSTGYYHSITRKNLSSGIGIAFNNTTFAQKPLLLKKNAQIKFTLTRGKAHLCADNNSQLIILQEGACATISLSKKSAKILEFH